MPLRSPRRLPKLAKVPPNSYQGVETLLTSVDESSF
jgi:hypothetical protein